LDVKIGDNPIQDGSAWAATWPGVVELRKLLVAAV
jgi:hypothetical protein